MTTALQHAQRRYGTNVVNAEDFKPGAFGLSIISGGIGKLISIGQNRIADDPSDYTHAWVVLDDQTVIEAEPGGAKIVPITKYLSHDKILVCDRPVTDAIAAIQRGWPLGTELTDPVAYWNWVESLVRKDIVATARSFENAPYGWLQYAYIGLAAHGVRPAWLKKAIGTERYICSQLVDEVMARNGIHLFKDERWPGEVSPGDLHAYVRGFEDLGQHRG